MRYIDADFLIEQLQPAKNSVWNKNDHSKSMSEMIEDFCTELKNAPTADVVPKSEVERLQAELDSKQFRCDSCDRIMLTGAEHRVCVKQAKAEVARTFIKRMNEKMGKHTHLLGKDYVQRIMREVKKELIGEEDA